MMVGDREMPTTKDARRCPEDVGPAGDQLPNNPRSGRKSRNISVFSYVASELTRGYLLERDESKYTERRQRVYTFMKTPRELEKFLSYGFFQCMDAFLFIFTFLPIRILMALVRLFTHPCGFFSGGSHRYLEPAHICDILKGVILVVCCFVVNHIDTSMMYHLVRGQAVIKLYVFYNMLEVCDRLFSGFGQDILDSLFWTATEPKDRKREHVGVLPHLLLAIVYVIFHTLLILAQATVLNVAFNSHNKALLTIMMSNNFVEIKGNLFKRVDKNNLFQISCSDVKERFQYAILLSVVFIRNMTEFSWNPDHIWVILPDAILVLLAEFIVDWVKHAFVTKFNEISSDAYQEFTLSLVQDMATSRQKHAFTDHSDQVSRRMGFTPLPLACLLFRVCSRSIKFSGTMAFAMFVLFYFCLMTFKVLNSIILLGHGSRLLSMQKQKSGKTCPVEIDSQVIPKKEEKQPKEEEPTKPETTTYVPSRTVNFDIDPVSPYTAGFTNMETSSDADWLLGSVESHATVRQCTSGNTHVISPVLVTPKHEGGNAVARTQIGEEDNISVKPADDLHVTGTEEYSEASPEELWDTKIPETLSVLKDWDEGKKAK